MRRLLAFLDPLLGRAPLQCHWVQRANESTAVCKRAPFLVFLVSRFFPDIMVSPCRLVDRRLTLLDSVEPTFFGKPTIHNRNDGPVIGTAFA